jgi:translation initiation factor 4G
MATTPIPKVPTVTLSQDKIEQKTKDLLEEFLHGSDLKEAIQCVKDLSSSPLMHVVVTTAFNHVLERSEVARGQTGDLIHQLLKEKVLTLSDVMKGVAEVLEYVEDLEIDIPQIWTYLGHLFAPLVDGNDNLFPFKHFKQIADPLVKIHRGGKFMGSVLGEAKRKMGVSIVKSAWIGSGLTWQDFMGQDDPTDIVSKYGLEFTLSSPQQSSFSTLTSSSSSSSSKPPSLDLPKIQQQLEDLMKKSDDDEIDRWIQSMVGPKSKEIDFLRALMISVVSSALSGESTNTHYNADAIKRHVKLLHKYLDRTVVLEVQALYALQALVHSLQHPPGLLSKIFDTLYDEDIISEEAFNTWHNSEDPKESEG